MALKGAGKRIVVSGFIAAGRSGGSSENDQAADDASKRGGTPMGFESLEISEARQRFGRAVGDAVAGVDEPYRLIFELAAETGARLGDALGLVWGDVDLDGQSVTFTHQLSKDQRVPLKTRRSRRCVEVTQGLTTKLRTARLTASASGDHDYVFMTGAGTPHDHRNIGGRVLTRAVRRAGLEAVERDGRVVEAAPTFHNLRHSHGSALIAAGWDIEEVSARLGHSDVGTTQRAYVHAYDAARRSEQRRHRLAVLYASVEAPTPIAVSALRSRSVAESPGGSRATT